MDFNSSTAISSNTSPRVFNYMNIRIQKEKGYLYYAVYSTFCVMGVLGNLVLYYAVKHKIGLFGERHTFTYLVKMLSILDIVLAAMIILDIFLVQMHVKAYQYEYCVRSRTVVLVYESYILLLIALDRYLAIRRPYSSSWNCCNLNRVVILIFVITGLLDVAEMIHKIVYQVNNWKPNINIYRGTLTFTFIFLLVLTIIIYILLCVTHYRYTKGAFGRPRLETTTVSIKQQRMAMPNSTCSVSVSSIVDNNVKVNGYPKENINVNNQVEKVCLIDDAQQETGENDPNYPPPPTAKISICCRSNTNNNNATGEIIDRAPRRMFCKKSRQDSPSTVDGYIHNPTNACKPKVSIQSTNSILERSMWKCSHTPSRHTRSSLRLILIVMSITGIYIVSLLPHIMAGWDLIRFPGYTVYNMFYLNSVVNPFIYFLSDSNLRNKLFRRLCREQS